jgi:serine kinase of HPr protein (carbohydrate metabolism regulator)
MTAAQETVHETVHGVALLLGETGMLVTGASGAGKSTFALALMAGWRHDPVRLVADDRVRLRAAGGRLVARPVEGFLGRIELRGIGMAQTPAMPSCVVRALVALQPEHPARLPQHIELQAFLGLDLPVLRLRQGPEAAASFITKWPYFHAFMSQV